MLKETGDFSKGLVCQGVILRNMQKISAHKQSITRNSFTVLPAGRWSDISENRAPSCLMVTWEDKQHHFKCPLFLLLPTFIYFISWAWCCMVRNSLWSVGVTCPGCISSQFPTHPNFLTFIAVQKAEKASTLCKSCLASTKASCYYQSCVQHKCKR